MEHTNSRLMGWMYRWMPGAVYTGPLLTYLMNHFQQTTPANNNHPSFSNISCDSPRDSRHQISNIQTANGVPCLHKSLAESHPHLPIFSFSVIFLPPSKKFSVCGSNIDQCFEALPQQVCLWSKGGWTQSKRTTKSSNENQFRNEWALALLYHRLDLTIICTI